MDLFQGIKDKIDFTPCARDAYEARVASKDKLLDIGGRNASSASRIRIDHFNRNRQNTIVSTDIVADFNPDIVDDICNTKLAPGSFDGIYCNAILEHVHEYWKAIDNMHDILEDGGEAFFYVPFYWQYHDFVDYHRFTFTEMARMLAKFSEVKVFSPDTTFGDGPKGHGMGFVFWHVFTLTSIGRFPRLFDLLSKATNAIIYGVLSGYYLLRRGKVYYTFNHVSRKEFCYYYLYLYMNHGFCAWVKK